MGQWSGEGRLPVGLARSLTGLAPIAGTTTETGGDLHGNPSEEVYRHADRTRDSLFTTGHGVAGMWHSKTHRHRNVDERGWGGRMSKFLFVGGSSRWLSNQEDGVVINAVTLVLGGKRLHARELRVPAGWEFRQTWACGGTRKMKYETYRISVEGLDTLSARLVRVSEVLDAVNMVGGGD